MMANLELKIPPAVLFLLFVGVIWLLNELLPAATEVSVPNWVIRVFLACGVLIALAGVVQFAMRSTSVNPHKPDRASSLVTTGVYRMSRNPMYLGMLIILTGAVLKSGQMAGFITLPLYVLYMNRYQIIPEEKVMTEKFGDAFKTYCKNVRRWI